MHLTPKMILRKFSYLSTPSRRTFHSILHTAMTNPPDSALHFLCFRKINRIFFCHWLFALIVPALSISRSFTDDVPIIYSCIKHSFHLTYVPVSFQKFFTSGCLAVTSYINIDIPVISLGFRTSSTTLKSSFVVSLLFLLFLPFSDILFLFSFSCGFGTQSSLAHIIPEYRFGSIHFFRVYFYYCFYFDMTPSSSISTVLSIFAILSSLNFCI